MAREAGLHNIDMERLRNYMLTLLETIRTRIKYTINSSNESDLLGEFMNLHNMNTLSVKVNPDHKSCTVISEHPSHALHIRYEIDTGLVYILQSEFRKFCSNQNVQLDKYLIEQKEKEVLVSEDAQKRLGSGTHIPTSTARVFIFKLQKEV